MSLNPFNVRSPEHVDAAYIAANFVEVFTDFPRLRDPENTFINGARGTGKSMLLRSLEPKVTMIRDDVKLASLKFLAVHVPLRLVEFGAPELTRSRGYAGTALGEHLLVMHVMLRVAELLRDLSAGVEPGAAQAFSSRFDELYADCGGRLTDPVEPDATPAILFGRIARTCEREAIGVRQHHTRMPFSGELLRYDGGLAGFLDFLVPLAQALRRVDGLPPVPLFVMLDDADNLPVGMQRVLNSWVSSRSTPAICLKITTQLGYATRRTLDNRVIESPHDYAEVDLSAVYTSDNDVYSKRVRQIVSKRLANAGCSTSVDAFFPRHEQQARRLLEIEAEIITEHAARREVSAASLSERKGSARARDERSRYTVPRYMRELASSRSGHTFSYAGFRSLVDVSSGVVRWFLEPASRMYDKMSSRENAPVESIPVGVQDEVLKGWSTEFLDGLVSRDGAEDADGDALPEDEASLHAMGHETELYVRLRNLVEGLGRAFRERLLDETASEQRVISVVLRDVPGRELRQVLDLGVRLGYLQRSDNAAKEALGGRRPRFILARRLGPHYRLDVSGYAAHLSVTAADLAIALDDPAAFVKRRSRQVDDVQLPLEL